MYRQQRSPALPFMAAASRLLAFALFAWRWSSSVWFMPRPLLETRAGNVNSRKASLQALAAGEVSPSISFEASAGTSLLASPSLRRALGVLLKLRGSDGGKAQLAELATRATSQLYMGETNWPCLLGSGDAWEAAGVPLAEAEEALRGVVQVMTLDRQLAVEVKIVSRNGFAYEGTVAGATMRFSLQSMSPTVWGQYSALAVTDGPPELFGKRMISVIRKIPLTELGAPVEPNAGDVVYFAEPDRAAILESIAWDLIPDTMLGMEGMLEQQQKLGQEVQLAPNMAQALDYARSLKGLDKQEKHRRLLDRLLTWPPLAGLIAEAEADPEWAELLQTLRPQSLMFYEALRCAMLRAKDQAFAEAEKEELDEKKTTEPAKKVVEVRISLFQIVGTILTAAALAFVAANVTKDNMRNQAADDLPLYSLNSTKSSKLVPLAAGTPLMPFSSRT